MSRFASHFEIAGRLVGPGEPAYVIAEAGANHNRDRGVARELIDVAAAAGVDAVKFQTYTGKDLYSSRTPQFEYLADERSPQELLDAIALPREWQAELAEHARDRDIDFFSSPFDCAAVDSLCELGVPAMKIASFEIVDLDLSDMPPRPVFRSSSRPGWRSTGRSRRRWAPSPKRAIVTSHCCVEHPSTRPSPRS